VVEVALGPIGRPPCPHRGLTIGVRGAAQMCGGRSNLASRSLRSSTGIPAAVLPDLHFSTATEPSTVHDR
jgi:hypothetical protein